ncbi:MAG: hypothetical protein AAFS13_02870 [Pseudomonadota bacterium]
MRALVDLLIIAAAKLKFFEASMCNGLREKIVYYDVRKGITCRILFMQFSTDPFRLVRVDQERLWF